MTPEDEARLTKMRGGRYGEAERMRSSGSPELNEEFLLRLLKEASAERDAAVKVVAAARRWRREEWGSQSSAYIVEARKHTTDELDPDDAALALIDALAALDAATQGRER